MTRTVAQLSSLAGKLAPEQQQVLLDIASELARDLRGYDSMSPEQHAALDEAIAEAGRGEMVDRRESDVGLDALF